MILESSRGNSSINFTNKKILLYGDGVTMSIKLYIIFFGTVLLSGFIFGCTENIPDQTQDSAQGAPTTYILKYGLNNRVLADGGGSTNTPFFGHETLSPSHVRGARIYDDFIIELAAAPPGPNPLVALADGGIPPDEWRCSGCHGFDYEGVSTFNGGAEINLQDLIPVRGRDEEFVIHMLQGGFMLPDGTSAHDYTGILTPQAMVDVADFVVNEVYDTHEVLSAATGVGLGDMMEGADMWMNDLLPLPTGVPAFIRADGTAFNCLQCHDGTNANPAATDLAGLKASATADPFRFLHRTNFGSPRNAAALGFGYGDPTVMPGLYEVVLTDGLHFGGPEQAGAAMHYIQAQP